MASTAIGADRLRELAPRFDGLVLQLCIEEKSELFYQAARDVLADSKNAQSLRCLILNLPLDPDEEDELVVDDLLPLIQARPNLKLVMVANATDRQAQRLQQLLPTAANLLIADEPIWQVLKRVHADDDSDFDE